MLWAPSPGFGWEAAMKCPRCGLENPDIANRCDCGYDFRSRSVKGPYSQEAPRQGSGRPLCLSLVALALGIAAVVVVAFHAMQFFPYGPPSRTRIYSASLRGGALARFWPLLQSSWQPSRARGARARLRAPDCDSYVRSRLFSAF